MKGIIYIYMLLPDNFYEMVQNNCSITVTTNGAIGIQTHTLWGIHVIVAEDKFLLLPFEDYSSTERNLMLDNRIKLSLRSSDAHGCAVGFIVKGHAKLYDAGDDFEQIKAEYKWASRVLKVNIHSYKQLL